MTLRSLRRQCLSLIVLWAITTGTAPGRAAAAASATPAEGTAPAALHHALEVELFPARHRIEVRDTLQLPSARRGRRVHVLLHAGLEPRVETTGATLRALSEKPRARHFGINGDSLHLGGAVPLAHYLLTVPAGVDAVTLSYAGVIQHPLEAQGEEYARSFQETPGTIGEDGAFLAGATFWVPWLGDGLVTFDLQVRVPAGWDAVSQGRRVHHQRGAKHSLVRWEEHTPQDEVFLCAARFTEYQRREGEVDLYAFLRSPDPGLAEKYLQTTAQYLGMYQRLIGPYPYAKFALVENYWETGYGMPSFTLLGPKIIRFPFILHSSYPHELLHNWWGNGVYVDYASGNWCEGLTTYLADHLIKEQRGQAEAYRRETLQKYADYVDEAKDFPLVQFRARHSSVTQAVGYGKTMMVLHMLRRELGDAAFVQGLQRFYGEQRSRRASFGDLAAALGAAAGRDLRPYFSQWTRRAGAPVLRLAPPSAQRQGEGWRLRLRLSQVQKGAPFRLRVPVAVTLEGTAEAREVDVEMRGRNGELTLELPARPLRVDVDPRFDVMRRLDRAEIPPALSGAFGAARTVFVLPAAAPAPLLQAYRDLVAAWQGSQPEQGEVLLDSDLEALPPGGSVWILGWDNRLRDAVRVGAAGYDAELGGDRARIGGTTLQRAEHSLVVAVHNPERPAQIVTWLATDRAAALPGLGRKLPHYGKYSALGFEGDEPSNVLKETWPVIGSPLTAVLAEQGEGVARARLAPLQALASLPALFSAERMLQSVQLLASPKLEGRGFGSPGLEQAAEWIADQYRDAGLLPGGDGGGSYFQRFEAQAGSPPRRAALRNVVGVIPGRDPALAGQSVVVGAHYDHLGFGWPDAHSGDVGKLHPGADDNASGVAVLLELARVLGSQLQPARSVVFVAFTGEEVGRIGSRHYVRGASSLAASRAIGMVNLDTVGRLGERKLTALGVGSAREWIHILFGAGHVTGVEVQPVSHDAGGSDQLSFIEAGVPAIQLFSGPHLDYHRPGDRADKVDVDGLVRVASVANEVIIYLADRREPLHRSETSGHAAAAGAHGSGPPTGHGGGGAGERRVSLGTVPDFAHAGPGVRLAGVAPGSPAERGGLRVGDVLVRIDDQEVADLRGLAGILRAHRPGDRVRVVYRRDDRELTVELTLVER